MLGKLRKIIGSVLTNPGIQTQPLTHPSGPQVEPIGPSRPGWDTDPAVPAEWRRDWIKKGYLILRDFYSKEAVQAHADIVAQARRVLPDGKDEFGHGDRVGQLHQKYPELMTLAADSRVLNFFRWAFDDEPLLFGSLNFDRGTQQELHIDSIFFYTEPVYSMAGLWVALEDVHPDAGPLFYASGSHRWPFFRGEHVLASNPDLAKEADLIRSSSPPDKRSEFVGRLGQEWTKCTLAMAEAMGIERELAMVKAGDAVIWHALLAHGGSPRVDPAPSRKSVVYHFLGMNAQLHTFEEFFLSTREELLTRRGQVNNRASWKDLCYIDYDYFVTYDNGKEIVHTM